MEPLPKEANIEKSWEKYRKDPRAKYFLPERFDPHNSVLSYALNWTNCLDIAKQLLNEGANPNGMVIYNEERFASVPVQMARRYQTPYLVGLCEKHTEEHIILALKLLKKYNLNLYLEPNYTLAGAKNPETIMDIAIRKGFFKLVKKLIVVGGYNVNKYNTSGITPILQAARAQKRFVYESFSYLAHSEREKNNTNIEKSRKIMALLKEKGAHAYTTADPDERLILQAFFHKGS